MADNSRKTLSMRIALEGTAAVKKDFVDLGASADKAFAKIKAAIDKVAPSFSSKLTGAVRAINTQFVALGAAGGRLGQSFGSFTLAVNTFGNAVANSVTKVALLTAAITGTVGALVLFAKNSAANSERIDNQAKSLGVSVEAYQNFETAAKNAGLEGATFDKILQKFVVNAATAGDASGKAASGAADLAKSLRQVEITASDGSKKLITVRGTSDAMGQSIKSVGAASKGSSADLVNFAKRVTALGTAQQRIQAVLDAGFDKKNAAATVTFLRALANDADDAARALSKTVGPLNALQIGAGVDLDNAFDRLGTNIGRTKDKLAALFSPAIALAVDNFANLIFDNQAAIKAWGETIAREAIVVVKDLIALLKGDDGAVQNKSLIAFRDGVLEFGRTVRSIALDVVVPAFNGIVFILDKVATAINAVFGTEFSGRGLAIAAVVLQITGAFGVLLGAAAVAAGAVQLLGSAIGLVLVALRPLVFALGFVGAAIAAFLGIPVAAGVAIAAGLTAAAVAIFVFWDEIAAAGQKSFDAIVAAGSSAVASLTKEFSNLGKIGSDLGRGDFAAAFDDIKNQSLAELKTRLASDVHDINKLLGLIGIDGDSLWTSITDATARAWEAITARVSAGVGATTVALRALGIDGASLWTGMKESGAQAFAAVQQSAETAFAAVSIAAGQAGAFVKQSLSGDFSGAFAAIQAAGVAAFAAISAASVRTGDAVIATFNGIGPALKSGWATVTTDADAAYAAIVAGGAALAASLSPAFAAVSASAASLWTGIIDAATTVWQGVVSVVSSAATSIASAVGGVAQAALEAWTGASASVAASAQTIVDAISRATQLSGDVAGAQKLAASLVQPFDQARQQIDALLQNIADRVKATLSALAAFAAASDLGSAFDGATSAITAAWDGMVSGMESRLQELVGVAQSVASEISSIISNILSQLAAARASAKSSSSSSSGGSFKPTPFASGGQVRGAGTGTSDSILARLSNGEFVVNARATAEWHPFIELINSGRLRFNDFAQRFADGGLVRTAKTVFELPGSMLDAASEALSPRFATGGPVTTRAAGPVSALTLVLGGENFDGLTGPVDTISRLERAIRGKKLRSAGRPSPYEGR